MIVLGIILLVLGLTIAPPVLARVGWILIIIGLVLYLISFAGGGGWYAYY